MRRRDFLKATGALVVGAMGVNAAVVDRGGITAQDIRNFVARIRAPEPDEYYFIVHPSIARDIRRLRAISEWQDAWRNYRIARRENLCGYLAPNEVLARFKPALRSTGELVNLAGFRFIETPA